MAERVILCGPVRSADLPVADRRPVRLDLWGPGRNVRFRYEDVRRWMGGEVPAAFRDLIDIAVYAYVADQALRRGSGTDQDLGRAWRRRLFFRVAVRLPGLWAKPPVRGLLERALGFLSEDEYHFQFERLDPEPPPPEYFDFCKGDDAGDVDEVVLFSGGLDSLAGAIQEAVVDRRRVILVHHRSATKRVPPLRRLLEGLRGRCPGAAPWSIDVWVDKRKEFNREPTQRTRSFLYACLASALAVMLKRRRVRFYENGVVSINLPPSAQVVGARATRTTHPQALRLLERLFGELLGDPFRVENPFQWETKADVVRRIAEAGCAELIRDTISCTRIWGMTREHVHCGVCSQCIDRRFAVLACGLGGEDPAELYGVDLLTGPREEGNPRTMLAVYLETASQLARMGSGTFFGRYGEATRVLRHALEPPEAVAQQVYQLYLRHAREVNAVVDRGLGEYAAALRQRSLPSSCLIRLVTDAEGGGAGAQPAETPGAGEGPPGPANVFRRKGPAWEVRFAGGEAFVLLPSKGAAYLHLLLSRPGASASAIDLACRVAKSPERYALGDAGEQLDGQAAASYRARFAELQADLERARKDHDPGAEEEARREMAWLAEQLGQGFGLGGRPRKASDDRERVRKAVGNAVRRAVRDIAESDRALAEHLSPPRLQCGRDLRYDPGRELAWEV